MIDQLQIYEYECSGPYQRDAGRYLAARISEVSEEALCASWMHGIEYTVWAVGTGEQESDLFDRTECARLVALGEDLGCWWVWPDGDPGPLRVTIGEWRELLDWRAFQRRSP